MENLVQIQSVGKVEGKQAEQFKVGEKMLWNFGYTSEVLKIERETKSFIVFKMTSTDPRGNTSTETYLRKLKKDRIVAIA